MSSSPGKYLYGFTDAAFQPPTGLCGLSDAPVGLITFCDIGAVVSDHPVETLVPMRGYVERHHHVMRQIVRHQSMVPAAFGHISDSETDLRLLLENHYAEIRAELERLAGKVEIGLKLRWNVDNVFQYLICTDQQLQHLRDKALRKPNPSFDETIRVGSLLEERLNAERERMSAILWRALDEVICEKRISAPREETTVCNAALLIAKARADEFGRALEAAAGLFNSNCALEYNGPWPPYSFVNLRLQLPGTLNV